MGLNPYFNESHSNLNYHEVQARIDNNSNVYERCTAHWYALANARSIGKPNTYAAQAEIFKTSHPGQLHLPSYVDPLAHKWTNTHYTNQAIVGSDNVEGTVLNYENWHQGVGLNSIADERYIASMRGVQQSARIENLKALQLGERVPDMRRVQNVRTGAAIISTVQKLRRELEDPNYLPEDGQKPTPQQEENIETFNNTVGMVAQAYAGFSYGDIRDAEAVQSEVNNFLRINQRSKKNLRSVGSSLNSLLQIVKSRPIGALPLDPSMRPIDDGSTLSKTGNVQAPGPGVPEAAAPAAGPGVPEAAAPAESTAAPAPVAPVDAALSAAPSDAAVAQPETTTATPPLPPSPVAAKPERQLGDILHLSPDEIQHLPVAEFDATINELKAMDASQFESFCIRYDELKSENALARKLLLDNFYKPFFLLRAKRKNERDRNYFFPGADYYGETWMGRADEPIVKRIEQRHRLNGGMPPRRKSQLQLTVHPAPATDVPGAPGTIVAAPAAAPSAPRQPVMTDANVQAIADAVSRAHVKMSKSSIQAFAEATKATIEARLKQASRQPRTTVEQRPQPPTVLSGMASALKTAAKGSAMAVGAAGLGALALSGLGQVGTIAAAGANPLGGPNANDYSITEGIMTPLAGLAEKALGPTGATIVTAAGSVLGPWVNAAARQRMGIYTLNQVATFATGDKRAANAGGLGAIYIAVQNFFTNRLKWDAEANRSRTEQEVIDEAKGEALNGLLPEIKDVVKKIEVNTIRKRYGLPTLVDTATQLTPPPGAPANPIPQPEGPSVPMPTSEGIAPIKAAVNFAKDFMSHRVSESAPEPEPTSTGATQRPMPNPRPMPPPTGGSGMRYERGDFTDAERLAQKRIKMSAEELAEELQSDEEAMDGEGGVQDSTIDVLSSMKGGMLSHRIPEGTGGVLPDLTQSNADLPPQAIDVMANVYVNFVYQALDYETMGQPYDPVQLANSEWNNWVNEQVSSSNPDRLVVGVKDAAHPNVPPKNVLNVPETLDFPVEGSLEGGMKIWERNKLAFQAYQARKVAEEAIQAAKRAEEASMAGTRNTVPRTAEEKALAASIAAAIAANPPGAFPNPVSAFGLGFRGGQPLEGIHPLEGGALYRGPLQSTLHGGGQIFAADTEVGKKYTFKQRPSPYRSGTQTFVAEVESKAPSPHGSQIRLQVNEDSGMGRSIEDDDYFIMDDVRQHEKHAAEALGRLHTGIPASAIGNIAEFLGHKDAIGELVRSEAADKGRPGDIPSVLRPREETGVAPGSHKRPLDEAAEPSSKRQKQGGEKPKRKVSEWSQLVAAVYKELKEKDPNVTIAMAAKEASSRRKAKSAT
jgi:hypothetical protein